MSMHGFDGEGSGHTERQTDRIYRENPELLGFGNGEKDDGFHPSRGSSGGGKDSGGCLGCFGLFVVFLLLGIAVLSMESDAAFIIYVIVGLIAVFAYTRTE